MDLYLIHWPADGWQQAWDDLQEIYASGRAKAIGVSNFQKHHIDELLTHSDVVPAVDQLSLPTIHQSRAYWLGCVPRAFTLKLESARRLPAVTYSATRYWPESVPSTAGLLHRY